MISKYLSGESLTRKAFLNISASGIDYLAKLVVGFIITPLLLSGLGGYFYGLWQILNRLFGYISTTSCSTSALKFILSKEQNIKNFNQKKSYVGSAIVIWVILLPFTSLLGGIITWFVPFWLNSPIEYYFQIRIVSMIFVIMIMLNSLSYLPYTILQGENQAYRRLGLSVVVFFVNGALTWLALYLKTGIIGVSFSYLLQALISGLFYYFVCKTYISWFGIQKPTTKLVKKFINFSGWFLAWDIVANLTNASDVVVLGMLDSVEAVTTYTLTKYVPEVTITLTSILVMGVIPGLGGIIGSGDTEKAAQIRGEMFSFTWLIITVIGTTTLLWNRFFLGLWVGSSQYSGNLSNLLIVIVVSQFVMIKTDGFIIDLKINIKSKVLWGAISAFASIGISIIFVKIFNLGFIGISLGLFLGRLILSIVYPKIVNDYLGLKFITEVNKILKPFIITTILFIVACLVNHLTFLFTYSVGLRWIILIVGVAFSSILILIFTFYIGFSRNQQKKMLLRVLNIINK